MADERKRLDSIVRQIVGRCHHFNGAQNECCKAGVNYSDLAGPIEGRNGLAGVHDVHTAGRVVRHAVGDVAKQVATYPADPPIADHQQVRVQFLGDCEEGVRRLPQASDRLNGNTRLLESLPSAADDLFRSDALVVA